MAAPKLFLFGPPRLEHGGDAIEISRRKAKALLAYLAVERQSQSRETLAALFWPDYDASRGRADLSRTLSVLNKALGPDWSLADRERVELNSEAKLWVDVWQFQQLLAASASHDHPQTELCPTCLSALTEAVDLYQADFLAGFTLPGSPAFDEWQFFQTETLRQELSSALERLVRGYSTEGDYEPAIAHARRWLELDPLHEPAQRELMRLYAWTGQPAAALRQYQECVRLLAEAFEMAPSPETTALYEAIKARRVTPAQAQPAVKSEALPPRPEAQFSENDGTEPSRAETTVFVARERELARLDEHLQAALAGQGRVVFVTGEAGRGKTTLLSEFARRAQATHADLIVANGHCNAYAGVGDPYLPFRDVISMLSGQIESRAAAGTITAEQARRLSALAPEAIRTLLAEGANLIDVFVPAPVLISRLSPADPGQAEILTHLQSLNKPEKSVPGGLEQRQLFEQVRRILRVLADRHPLLLLLDDLQWADGASINLLFHLGRRLAGSPILIVGTYRPSEVALGRAGIEPQTKQSHPLEPVVNELKRHFGDIQMKLEQITPAEGRAFVDALLDSQPNRLAESFRGKLFRRTEGHPLFTIELLREMQERGDLIRDEQGRWMTGTNLDWEALPVRVEAVIEQRIDRLEEQLQDILTVASVEGEAFTAQVIAQVQQLDERTVLRRLSRELEQRHRLVREHEEVKVGNHHLLRYQFSHVLFQQYLFNRLSAGERRLLHREIARTLERLYEGYLGEVTMQLAHHYTEAGDQEQAITYLLRAGDQARRGVALQEAARFYRAALERWPVEDPAGRAETLHKLGECLWVTGQTQAALETFEEGYRLFDSLGDTDGAGAMQRLIARMYWEQGERAQALQHYHRALAILEQGPESAELARAISALSQMHMLASEYDQAIALGERAQAMAERLAVEDVIVHALNNIGSSVFVISDPESGLALLQESLRRALALNLPHDACRAYTNMGEGLIWQCRYEEARTTFEDLHAYASRIHASLFSHVALTRLAELDWLAGRWADAWPRFQKLIEIHDRLKSGKDLNRVWISILRGWIHNDLGQPRAAQRVLESELPGAQVANEIQITVPHLGQLARAYAAGSMDGEAEATLSDMLDMIDSVPHHHPCSTAYLLFTCQWFAARKMVEAREVARACLRRLEQANRQIRTLETEAALNEGRGSLAVAEGDHQQAAERFQAALTGWEALARPYDQLRTLSVLGQSLTRLGQAGQARTAFDQALGISQILADQLEDEELQNSFFDSPLVRRIRRD